LGLQLRQGFARLRAKKEAESHTTYSRECERVWGNEPSHPQGVPLWELESRWTSKSSKDDCRAQNSISWGVPYIIGKLLKRRCLKWVRITHLDIWNTSYDQKKSRESKLSIWFPTIKSQELTWFLCVQVVCDISLKISRRGIQLCFRPHLHWRPTCKVMAPQSCRSPNLGNFGTPTWESRDKKPFGCEPYGQPQSIL
jgi:hypothetical protein